MVVEVCLELNKQIHLWIQNEKILMISFVTNLAFVDFERKQRGMRTALSL